MVKVCSLHGPFTGTCFPCLRAASVESAAWRNHVGAVVRRVNNTLRIACVRHGALATGLDARERAAMVKRARARFAGLKP